MFNVLDIVFILIILVFSIIATAKGFVKEIFNKASWILGIILGVIFCKKSNLTNSFGSPFDFHARILNLTDY